MNVTTVVAGGSLNLVRAIMNAGRAAGRRAFDSLFLNVFLLVDFKLFLSVGGQSVRNGTIICVMGQTRSRDCSRWAAIVMQTTKYLASMQNFHNLVSVTVQKMREPHLSGSYLVTSFLMRGSFIQKFAIRWTAVKLCHMP